MAKDLPIPGWKPSKFLTKEQVLNKHTYDVLDGGSLRLVDWMGDDTRVVEAARVSFKHFESYSGDKGPEKNLKLMKYLYNHEHMTPFEHVVMTFYVKAPVFVARQWFRHRSSSYNEASARYSAVNQEYHMPYKWRYQSNTAKQCSFGELSDNMQKYWSLRYDNVCRDAFALYKAMLADGICREQARMVLPQSMYTEWVWTVNLRNLLHFIFLRDDDHAQQEIREYAIVLGKILADLYPQVQKVMDVARAP